jgi:hypothetical protein
VISGQGQRIVNDIVVSIEKKHVPETLALAFMLVPHKTGWTGGGIRGEGGA